MEFIHPRPSPMAFCDGKGTHLLELCKGGLDEKQGDSWLDDTSVKEKELEFQIHLEEMYH